MNEKIVGNEFFIYCRNLALRAKEVVLVLSDEICISSSESLKWNSIRFSTQARLKWRPMPRLPELPESASAAWPTETSHRDLPMT